jgi:YVTN family beta-propeller protein
MTDIVPGNDTKRSHVKAFSILIAVVVVIQLIINGLQSTPSAANLNCSSNSSSSSTTQSNSQPTNVWIAESSSNDVVPVNYLNGTLDNRISVGLDPDALILDPTGLQLYVVNKGSDNISVVSLYSGRAYRTINVGSQPSAVTINPLSNVAEMFVLDQGSQQITPIKLLGLKVQHPISAGPQPTDLAVDDTSNVLYVTDAGDNSVLPIDLSGTQPVLDQPIPVGNDPTGIYISHNNPVYAYVINSGSNSLSVIDLAKKTVVNTVNLSGSPTGLSVSDSLSTAFVTLGSLNEIALISTGTDSVSEYLHIGDDPVSIISDINGEHGFILNAGNNTGQYVDLFTGNVLSSVQLNPGANALTFLPP